jgi:hypothetical protein
MMITNDCFENSKRVKNMTFDKIYNNLKSLVRVALASTHIYIYIYIETLLKKMVKMSNTTYSLTSILVKLIMMSNTTYSLAKFTCLTKVICILNQRKPIKITF